MFATKKEEFPKIWYQNDAGEKYVPEDPFDLYCPPGFVYQYSQFPTTVTESILRSVLPEEVDACSHPERYIKETFGWIEGKEGWRPLAPEVGCCGSKRNFQRRDFL